MKILGSRWILKSFNMNKNISHHHGHCNMCGRRNVLILMLGYQTQDVASYRICKDCFAENIHQIIFGFHNFTDGLISVGGKK